MSDFRLIQCHDRDGGLRYRIEDMVSKWNREAGAYPFVQHEDGLLVAGSINELRATLKEMLNALDKPALRWMPARLEE